MHMITLDTLLFIIAGALAGGFINGLAGTGTAIFALGWWLMAVPLKDAVTMVVIMSLIGGIQGLFAVRVSISLLRLRWFILPALIGLPFGYMISSYIEIKALKIFLALLLGCFGGAFIFQPNLPKLSKNYLFVDICVGFLGGLLGAVAGLSGAILTMWCSLQNWSKMEKRTIIQPYNVTVLSLVAFVFFWQGALDWHILVLISIAVPFSVLGTQFGIFLFRRINTRQFNQILIWLILGSGLILLGQEILFEF